MEDLLDFVAEHGATHIVIGSEQTPHSGPLPRDRGMVLVAGSARRGGFRPRFRIPAGSVSLTPDHSRLGVCSDNCWTLFDLATGQRGFVLESRGPWWLEALHPSGEMLARRTAEALELWLPDGQLLRSLAVPRRKSLYRNAPEEISEMLTFSACGEYLWFGACPTDPPDGLWLISVPRWEVLARIPVPRDPDNYSDRGKSPNDPQFWWENDLLVHPETGWLAVNRYAGDSFLAISFHRAEGGKIITHDRLIGVSSERFDGEPVNGLGAGPGGRWYLVVRYGELSEWDWPSCQCTNTIMASAFEWDWDDYEDWYGPVARIGEVVLATRGRAEICCMDAAAFEPLRTVRPCMVGDLLPNGMLLRDRGELCAWEVSPDTWPVVLEMCPEARGCRRVWRKVQQQWLDVSSEVAWVSPAFAFRQAEP